MTVIHEDAVLGQTLRSQVPEVAAEVTIRIRLEFPALGTARYLDSLVESLVGHFLDLLADPGATSDEVLRRAREAGVEEAMEGRGPEILHGAARLGAGVAIARMTENAQRLGMCAEISAVGRMVQAAFAYTERIAEAVSAGHGSATAGAGDVERRRRKLLELLLCARPGESEIREAACDAGWPMPRSIAAVALRSCGPGAVRPTLPPETLLGLYLDEPCLIMPDPDGPGRRRQLGSSLRGWSAAIGPTVAVTDAARSLRWAGHAMDLLRSGRVRSTDRPVRATDHLPHLMTSWGADLVDLMAADRLAPLDSVRAPLRYELEATLLALLECHFRANVAAARLHVHPQTVRYRLRKLETLFGDALYEPRDQLDLHLLLYSRLTERTAAKPA